MQSNECMRNCWIAAGVIGLLVWIFTSFIGETSVMGGLFLGLITAVLMGLFLVWAMCRGSGSAEDERADQARSFAAPASASAQTSSTAAASSGSVAMASAAPTSADGASDQRKKDAEAQHEKRQRAAQAEQKALDAAAEEEAAKNGRGKQHSTLSVASTAKEVKSAPSSTDPEPAKAAKPAKAEASDKPAKGKKDKKNKKKSEAKAAKADKPAKTKSKSEKPAKAKDKAADKPAKKAKSKSKDDLKQIKGVGPKMEKLLHQNGVTEFAQIAAWDDSQIDEFAEKIGSMGGRIRSDDWVAQASKLMDGGQTEFSQRVEKGDVY
ncbi:hypothetical protein [Paracoccus tegillarcae]|uniref:Uncharacterized protein n=1 Tax=Paracoccus tegillarcae TaxID=1529068 RepID=A0A2K9F762_9RHOB|nr:hypothetical protein [Paracoccus tegillarcae]AUH35031.1 hypothetical protein CUV01_18090 [Paracoccus tegillarcae]